MQQRYDVIVVGAGPGGSAAAYYLAQAGLHVLLLDKSDFPRDKTCGDGLTPRALAVLNDMGLLTDLCQVGFRINSMNLYAPNGGIAKVTIPLSDTAPNYMLIVPRYHLDDMIRQRAITRGVHFASPINVIAIERRRHGVVVKAHHNDKPITFQAQIAIIATGANLRLLEQIEVVTRPPRMMLAMRAYFEQLTGLADQVDCHFDGIPLPGYGWVFPLSPSSANIGIGFLPSSLFARLRRTRARGVFESFLRTPLLRQMLASAQQNGPIKGYPIRVDFDQSRTMTERILLVGEAAGLVNPLTGEGIDYALESGKIAAEHLIERFASSTFTMEALSGYDQRLRQRFQRLFVLSNRLRSLYLNPFLLNRVLGAAAERPDINAMLTDIAIGNRGIAEGVSLKTLFKVLLPA